MPLVTNKAGQTGRRKLVKLCLDCDNQIAEHSDEVRCEPCKTAKPTG